MVNKKPEHLTHVLKSLTIKQKHDKIVKEKLKAYGQFSGFVQYCLEKEKLIDE